MKKIVCFSLLGLMSTISNATPFMPDSFNIFTSFHYTALSGFMQIPVGGTPGTSSLQRPTLSELGMKNNFFYEAAIAPHWGRLGLWGDYQYDRPTGSHLIHNPLISHGVLIPAGSSINTKTRFDLYQLAASYDFYFDQQRLTIHPEIVGSLLNFGYQFSIPTVSSSRNFRASSARVGAGLTYAVNSTWSIAIESAFSIPGQNFLLNTANVNLYDRLWQHQTTAVTLFAGIGVKQIDFEDAQTLPNHIRVTEWPIGTAGLKLTL